MATYRKSVDVDYLDFLRQHKLGDFLINIHYSVKTAIVMITGCFKKPPRIDTGWGPSVHLQRYIQDCKAEYDLPASTPDTRPLNTLWLMQQSINRLGWRIYEDRLLAACFDAWRSGLLDKAGFVHAVQDGLTEKLKQHPTLEMRSECSIFNRIRFLGLRPVKLLGGQINWDVDGETLTLTEYLTRRV